MLILRWSAPLFFANATQFRDRMRAFVAAADPAPRWVVVAAEPIADIDTTAGTMLIELHAELSAAGIHFAFAELQTAVRESIARYRPPDDPKAWHFYASVTEAVEAFQRERAAEGGVGAGSAAPR
jgi:MFS superfamily sulfate permease-like transporter